VTRTILIIAIMATEPCLNSLDRMARLSSSSYCVKTPKRGQPLGAVFTALGQTASLPQCSQKKSKKDSELAVYLDCHHATPLRVVDLE
jgi:hypothetical protein